MSLYHKLSLTYFGPTYHIMDPGVTFSLYCDTHTMSRNGKLLCDLVQKYNLYLLNSPKVCSGVFTRTRQCNGKQEISVLDYVFVTSDIHEQVRSMEIDEKNFFTPWRKLRKGRRFSDHHAIKLSLNLEFSKSPKGLKS